MKKSGFTIIETLLAIAIISLVLVAVFPLFQNVMPSMRANNAKNFALTMDALKSEASSDPSSHSTYSGFTTEAQRFNYLMNFASTPTTYSDALQSISPYTITLGATLSTKTTYQRS